MSILHVPKNEGKLKLNVLSFCRSGTRRTRPPERAGVLARRHWTYVWVVKKMFTSSSFPRCTGADKCLSKRKNSDTYLHLCIERRIDLQVYITSKHIILLCKEHFWYLKWQQVNIFGFVNNLFKLGISK